ncbi:MAG: septal ring lytic transglycosylase RlpA family protein [Coriobacteriia bacterium]|nr:septal ring lytic transglycosylase RlpA family protein [Coriobacteriia bacterium]
MSLRRTTSLILATAVALCLALSFAMPAIAAPPAAQTSADRAALERAVEQYEAAIARSAQLQAQAAEASSRLDHALEDEAAARERLRRWILTTYRSDDIDFMSVLFGASTFEDFIARWDLLTRIARQDAEILEVLRAARIEAELSAGQLLDLQAQEARALDALAEEVTRAKRELAASEAALREYEARTAANTKAAATDRTRQLTGSGAWQTAVASHYGINFTGRGASGEAIGPYSMMVAHKTLPFGTLVEFEYNGKRAVASVEDCGPYTEGRTFDLGPGVIRILGFRGVHEVRYRIITS